MSDKELLQKISQYAERRVHAKLDQCWKSSKDVDYVVPMSDMPEIIALVHDYYGYKDPAMVSMGTAHEADIRADERQRCIDAAKSLKTYKHPIGHKHFLTVISRTELIEALEKQE